MAKSAATLLPVPLIVVMVASVALPVLAFVMILQRNQTELAQLKIEVAGVEAQNKELAAKAATRKEEELATDNYKILEREFRFRFFTEAKHAEEFWTNKVAKLASIKVDNARPRPGPPLTPKADGEFVGMLTVTGTHRDHLQFLFDLYQLKRAVYFPSAACVKVSLPDEALKTFKSHQLLLPFVAKDATDGGRGATAWGYYFEPFNESGTPMSPDQIALDTMPREGNLWYIGAKLLEADPAKPDQLTDEKLRQMDARDAGWIQSLDYLKAQIAEFTSGAGRPFTDTATSEYSPNALCPRTGALREEHTYPVFFYAERFEIIPIQRRDNAGHQLKMTLVFPISKEPGLDIPQPQ